MGNYLTRACAMLAAGVLAAWALPAPAASGVDLEAFLRRDMYETAKISPDGAYYAVTAPVGDGSELMVFRRSDMTQVASITRGNDPVVEDFWWANKERVLVAFATRFNNYDAPVSMGELHAVNVDGSQARVLSSPFGLRDDGPAQKRLPGTLGDAVYMLDRLREDPDNVLVLAVPYQSDPTTSVERLNVYSRRRSKLTSVPARNARFVTDAQARVRLAIGTDLRNHAKLYYRDDEQAAWRLVHDEGQDGTIRHPVGFSADGRLAYLQVEHAQGPDSLVAWDPQTGQSNELLRDPVVDPYRVLYDLDERTPIGALYMTDRIHYGFFDEQAPIARLYRMLEKAFGGDAVRITSATDDGRELLVYVWSDRNNGDYFVFDTDTLNATRLFGRREWFAPDAVPPSRLISFAARDGMPMYGYLTEPLDKATGPRPMVLLPHGGPFGVRDEWAFDDDAQILAAAGYAVLRVNFRGSGGYGRAHQRAGEKEWGGRMQDDLTDATRWAIEQGIADPSRICIYGASYGGYAALMGVAKEPDLYRCAAGYVGAYDLQRLHRDFALQARTTGAYAAEWIGERSQLAERSPVNLAERIKAPVFLAAGGKDHRTTVEHTRDMERALRKAGVPVEALYFPQEAHGFYGPENRRQYYTRLLGFLSDHLGGARAR